jgi:aminopeptidase N
VNNKFLRGKVEIHAVAVSDFKKLQLDLHKNFTILSLTDKNTGKPLDYTRDERAIIVQDERNASERFVYVVEYEGKPPVAQKPPWKGGFVWKEDKGKNPWLGVACESEGASLWWPLKDHTSDEPDSMRLHYTVPKGLTAVGNGQLENVQENKSTSTFHWFVSYPINTYNVTIYVGDFQKISDTYAGINGENLALDYYVLPVNRTKAESHFQQVKPILKNFEELFGEYPWYRDGFKLVESPYAGMEHQTAIAYGNGYKNQFGGSFDYIILHETAHEWWGNSITARDLAHVWLQEGFATYAEALYHEKTEGERGYMYHMFMYRMMIKNKYPVVAVEDRRWFHFRDNADVYMKGAWILHTLRDQIANDAVFFDIIKTFHEENKRTIVDSDNFIELVNRKTEKDFNWFFAQYLYKNELPELEYYANPTGKFYYRWKNMPDSFRFGIKIKSESQSYTLYPTVKTQVFDLPRTSASQTYSMNKFVLCIFTENKNLATP